jgi:hypothetical protein
VLVTGEKKNPTTHPEQEPDPQNDVHRYLTSTQEQRYYPGPNRDCEPWFTEGQRCAVRQRQEHRELPWHRT